MDAEDAALTIVDAVENASIEYLLTGSFASNFYGIPRSTQDADFVLRLGDKSILSLRHYLPANYQLDPQMEFEIVTGTHRSVVRIQGTSFEVELFRLSLDPHDQTRFQRRRKFQLFNRLIFLPTAEDVIVTKLRWLRSKDETDIAGVIAVQGQSLDWNYIQHWSDQHDTRSSLEAIKRRVQSLE